MDTDESAMRNPDDPTLTINTGLFRKIQRAILKWPYAFDMSTWGYHLEYTPAKRAPDCGSEACLAGWAVALSGGHLGIGTVWDRATQLLGVTPMQSVDLFFFSSAYGYAKGEGGTPTHAKSVSRRIDRFLTAMKTQNRSK